MVDDNTVYPPQYIAMKVVMHHMIYGHAHDDGGRGQIEECIKWSAWKAEQRRISIATPGSRCMRMCGV